MARYVSLGLLLVGLTMAILTPSPPADAASGLRRFIIMGDSWGYLMLDPFKAEFDQRGLGNLFDVWQTSIPGTTAEFWANNELGALDVVTDWIAIDPTRPVVYISLSGNDVLQQYPTEGMAVFEGIEADLRAIVDALVAARPDVRILLAGYDILNFDRSEFCQTVAQTIFGSNAPQDINPLFLQLGDIQAALDADYPQVIYTNLWGTLQGQPGEPDITSWSPEFWLPEDENDCVHLNEWGYRRFIDAMFDQLLGAD